MTAFHQSAEWAAFKRQHQPRIAAQVKAGSGVCINCGRVIAPWEKWAMGHKLDAARYPEYRLAPWNIGPTHNGKGKGRNCNQKSGGAAGARKTNSIKNRKKDRDSEFPEW